jgi:hypothetical protein
MAAPEPDIEKLQALSAQMERKLNDGSLTYEIWRGSRGVRHCRGARPTDASTRSRTD